MEQAQQAQQSDKQLAVVVFADFVCPYSYLAADQIDRLVSEYPIRALWRPHWLHPEIPPEGRAREQTPDAIARRERLDAWLREMAPELYPTMRVPERQQFSFLAFEALEFADDRGASLAYKSEVYRLMWREGRDIGDVETLVEAAEAAGLPADEMASALGQHQYAERALQAVHQARELEVTATPTLFLGRTRINGWHYYEVLQTVLEKQGVSPRAGGEGGESAHN